MTGAVDPGPKSNKWYDTWAEAKGISVKVSTNDGTFSIPGVPVSEGTNSVSVTVEDVSGNVSSQTVGFTKTSVDRTEWLTYDNNGNLVSVTSATSVVQYFWDMENRLTKVASNGVTILECWYDGQGRRLAKREVLSGQTNKTMYVYDGWEVVAVLDGQGQLLEYYTRGSGIAGDIGTIIAETKFSSGAATNTYYYHNNHRGDITAVRSTSATTLAAFDYRPYGEVRSSTGSFNPRYRFSSKEYDQASGLYNFGYRHYAPSLGRFVTRDPIVDAGFLTLRRAPFTYLVRTGEGLPQAYVVDPEEELNLYGFVGNSPQNRTDSLGLKKDPACVNGCMRDYQQRVDEIREIYIACMGGVTLMCMDWPVAFRGQCILIGTSACGAASIALHTAAASALAGCISGCPEVCP